MSKFGDLLRLLEKSGSTSRREMERYGDNSNFGTRWKKIAKKVGATI